MLIDIPLSFEEQQPMEPTPGQPGNPSPQFRHDIPSYAPPDRAAWLAQHRAAPYPVAVHPKFLSRARHACGIDYGTLNFRAAVDAHSALETVNTAATYYLRSRQAIGEQDEAWFDPTEDRFYIYPG